MRFSGKTVIVTGAASGIGAAATALFASEGAIVFAADIDVDGGEKLAADTAGDVRFARCLRSCCHKGADGPRRR